MISFSVKPFSCNLAIFSLHLNLNSFILIASVWNLQKTTLAFLSIKSLDLFRIIFREADSTIFSLEFKFRNWRTLHFFLHQCYGYLPCVGSYVQSQFLPAVIFSLQTQYHYLHFPKTKNCLFVMGKSFSNFLQTDWQYLFNFRRILLIDIKQFLKNIVFR